MSELGRTGTEKAFFDWWPGGQVEKKPFSIPRRVANDQKKFFHDLAAWQERDCGIFRYHSARLGN